MAKPPDITPELCRQLLRYEPETGKLFWRTRDTQNGDARAIKIFNTRYAGKEAGHIRKDGYILISLGGTPTLAHRIAFAIVEGIWPIEIDHDDRDPSNNRWINLADIGRKANRKNISARKDARANIGVWWQASIKKWRARIGVDGVGYNLGSFANVEDAIAARKTAEVRYGYNRGHGTPKKKDDAKAMPSRRP